MFRKIIKKVQEKTFKPLILWYLKKERRFQFQGLKMTVMPGVFHPLFFHSTLILAKYLKSQNLKGKTFLEPGSGSGMISLLAAQTGALVTALDLNAKAVENTSYNAKANNLDIKVVKSDLLTGIDPQNFDFIIINPPYYPGKPKSESQLAWYCGENFEYFKNLFEQLPSFYNTQSQVIMILSEDCDLNSIQQIAAIHQQKLELVQTHNVFFEKNYLFKINTL
ncbi:MAG TPA: methyltransferase [Bacteroidia bacterium]|nr:methyltransferase [Bacteroidia bacterium]